MKKLLAVAMGILIASAVQAQHRYNAWFRTTLSMPVGEKLTIDGELQHRRQNGFNNTDLLDKNLVFTFRNWIHYQHQENIKFSVSPFAWFSNYKIIQKPGDETGKPNGEIRFSAAAELQHLLFKKVYIVDRTAAEYRIIENNQSNITRWRNRLGIRYDITGRLKLSVFDELLLHVSGTTTDHFFDHDRIGLQMTYKLGAHWGMDIGYIHISRLPLTGDTRLKETNVFLHFTYQLRGGVRKEGEKG